MNVPKIARAAAALAASALAGGLPAHAAAPSSFDAGGASLLDRKAWLDRTMSCGPSFDGTGSDGLHCLAGEYGGILMDGLARLAQDQGRAAFGEKFQVVHRLSWSPYGEGLSGDLDAVVPMASFLGGAAADVERRAFFMQQGVTRWRDEHDFRRNDIRWGAVYRFPLSDGADSDVLGIRTVIQKNLERGHRRLVAGFDYSGRWGSGSLQHFAPTTGWRPGRRGFEERAIGGTELALNLAATTTIGVTAALARWDDDGAGRSFVDGRLGVGWRPHTWLSFEAGLGGIGPAKDTGAVRAALRIPLGGGAWTMPRWQGLGVVGAATARADVWRPMDNIGRIRIAERAAAPESRVSAADVEVRFLQDSIPTGGEVGIEVSIPAALSEDLVVELRLVPGEGNNPVVAGVDYVDEPVEVTIRRGTTSARARIRLLHNPDMREARTIDVDVSIAG